MKKIEMEGKSYDWCKFRLTTAWSVLSFWKFSLQRLKMTYRSAQIAEFLGQYNESNTSLNEFCRQKQISVGTMSNWLNGALPKRRRSHGFHKTWYPEIEEELLRWVLERRDQGYAVYRKDMKEYQKKFSKTRKFGPFRTRAKFTGPMLTVHFTHGRHSISPWAGIIALINFPPLWAIRWQFFSHERFDKCCSKNRFSPEQKYFLIIVLIPYITTRHTAWR